MIPMVPLVSFEMAQGHIKAPTEDDADLIQKIKLASLIVMDHMKLTEIPDDWDASGESPLPEVQSSFSPAPDFPVRATSDESVIATLDSPATYIRVPGNVQSAILLVIGELFENREASTSEPFSNSVVNLLSGRRDPTFS